MGRAPLVCPGLVRLTGARRPSDLSSLAVKRRAPCSLTETSHSTIQVTKDFPCWTGFNSLMIDYDTLQFNSTPWGVGE